MKEYHIPRNIFHLFWITNQAAERKCQDQVLLIFSVHGFRSSRYTIYSVFHCFQMTCSGEIEADDIRRLSDMKLLRNVERRRFENSSGSQLSGSKDQCLSSRLVN